jgi:DNA-binding MarR family transcriptional regulator
VTSQPPRLTAPLTPAEETAWRALARAVIIIPKVLDRDLLESEGLSQTEYSVLMNLSEQPGRSMRMSELADVVWISVSGLTRVVERLARQGLVERVRAKTDGRGQLAVLTAAGFARLEKAYPAHLASVRKHVMDHLANIDLAAFTDAMAQIAEAENGPPVRRIAGGPAPEPERTLSRFGGFQRVRLAAVGSVAVHEPRWCARRRGGGPGRRAAGNAAGQDVQSGWTPAGAGRRRPGPAAAVQGAARRRRDAGDGAGEALAIERGVATEQIAAAEGWRCTPPRSTGCRTRCCTWPPA